MKSLFFPSQSITNYHEKHNNVGQNPCLSMSGIPGHADIYAGKMGLLNCVVYCYSGPYLETLPTFPGRCRCKTVSILWLSLPKQECSFLPNAVNAVIFLSSFHWWMEACFLFEVAILALNSGYVPSHGVLVFFLEVFSRFPETKLLFCSYTGNYASRVVHFSYYHYHMQLLKSFKSRLKNPYKRGFSSG